MPGVRSSPSKQKRPPPCVQLRAASSPDQKSIMSESVKAPRFRACRYALAWRCCAAGTGVKWIWTPTERQPCLLQAALLEFLLNADRSFQPRKARQSERIVFHGVLGVFMHLFFCARIGERRLSTTRSCRESTRDQSLVTCNTCISRRYLILHVDVEAETSRITPESIASMRHCDHREAARTVAGEQKR